MDYGFPDFPLGLGMALLMNKGAKEGFDNLTETEKEHIILRCKDARSKDEMDRIVDSLSSSDKIRDLLDDRPIG